jgi:hypothetical protein
MGLGAPCGTILANRYWESRCRHKKSELGKTSIGVQHLTALETRRRSCWLTVSAPAQVSERYENEAQDAMRHGAGRPTHSAASRITTTPKEVQCDDRRPEARRPASYERFLIKRRRVLGRRKIRTANRRWASQRVSWRRWQYCTVAKPCIEMKYDDDDDADWPSACRTTAGTVFRKSQNCVWDVTWHDAGNTVPIAPKKFIVNIYFSHSRANHSQPNPT